MERLTAREIEIINLISEGNDAFEIAKILNISEKTVETHRTNIRKKLGVKNVAQMMTVCFRNKILI